MYQSWERRMASQSFSVTSPTSPGVCKHLYSGFHCVAPSGLSALLLAHLHSKPWQGRLAHISSMFPIYLLSSGSAVRILTRVDLCQSTFTASTPSFRNTSYVLLSPILLFKLNTHVLQSVNQFFPQLTSGQCSQIFLFSTHATKGDHGRLYIYINIYCTGWRFSEYRQASLQLPMICKKKQNLVIPADIFCVILIAGM